MRTMNPQDYVWGRTCSVIAKFTLGGRTCEFLDFFYPEDLGRIDPLEILARGRNSHASMDPKAFEFFWRHRFEVPGDYKKYKVGFLETEGLPGGVKFVYWDAVARETFSQSLAGGRDWEKTERIVLVRFS